MIICVSLNPAIDRRLRVGQLKIGAVNRATEALPMAGGKAAHVALAARALGADAVWLGFSGGATGAFIERELTARGIRVIAVKTRGETRENLEIIDGAGQVTEVLEPGAAIAADELDELRAAFQECLKDSPENAQAVLSGSLPPDVPTDIYAELIGAARAAGRRALLDASGEALRLGAAAGPDLVKPNRAEAEWLLGRAIADETAARNAARRLIARGAMSVALTLGGQGLVFLSAANAETLLAVPPQVEVISTVGCGDATLAGFAVAYQRGLSAVETLRLATACGAANCHAALPGQIDSEEVARLLPQIIIEGGNATVKERVGGN